MSSALARTDAMPLGVFEDWPAVSGGWILDLVGGYFAQVLSRDLSSSAAASAASA